jgi:hypothetical protein
MQSGPANATVNPDMPAAVDWRIPPAAAGPWINARAWMPIPSALPEDKTDTRPDHGK